ncbi:acyltransferase family protein [Luteimicrobium sp. DT211]|uniref:acyltransferase family protein n=1 Tax=Luteimicrobium sp. DT211 TaxID=3393412 RepID=UPI003CEAA4CB
MTAPAARPLTTPTAPGAEPNSAAASSAPPSAARSARPGTAAAPPAPAPVLRLPPLRLPGARPAPTRERFALVDGLRLLAALGVVLYHFTARTNPAWHADVADLFPNLGGVTVYGALGVELFFLISGFVILMSAWGRTVPAFVASRVGRLYPAYWLGVLSTGFLLLVVWPRKDLGVHDVAVNLTMAQAAFGVNDVDGVYWTLWTELRFYLLVGLLMIWGFTPRRVTWLCAVWPPVAWFLATRLPVDWSSWPGGINWPAALLVDQYAGLFAAGMMIFLVARHGVTPARLAVLASNAGLVVWLLAPRLQGRFAGTTEHAVSTDVIRVGLLVATALLLAATWSPLRRVRWSGLVLAGALTYPVYLLHEWWGWWLIHLFPAGVPAYLTLATVLLVVLGVAALVHHGLEKRAGPALRRGVTRALERTTGALGRVVPRFRAA